MTEKEKQIMVACEYCGGMVNILNHEFCPGCGARFSEEQLEKNRRIIDKYNTEILNKKYHEPEYREAEPSAPQKKSKKGLLIIPAVILIAVALVFIFLPRDENDDMEEYETEEFFTFAVPEPAEKLPYGYEKIDCSISGDKKLFDDGVTEIKITGLYEDTSDSRNKIIEYIIVNSSDADIQAKFSCKSVNGKTDDSINCSTDETVDSHSEKTFYTNSFKLEDKNIKELVFSDVSVCSINDEQSSYKLEPHDSEQNFRVVIYQPIPRVVNYKTEN